MDPLTSTVLFSLALFTGLYIILLSGGRLYPQKLYFTCNMPFYFVSLFIIADVNTPDIDKGRDLAVYISVSLLVCLLALVSCCCSCLLPVFIQRLLVDFGALFSLIVAEYFNQQNQPIHLLWICLSLFIPDALYYLWLFVRNRQNGSRLPQRLQRQTLRYPL